MAFEYLEHYATFDSVADMDAAVEQHIQQHYFDLTESERTIVFTLAARSLMYPGACHLKAETIADQVGVSTKTVYRAVKKLVELSIIEKVASTKLNGIKGASIYRILPFQTNVLSEVSEREITVEVSNDAVCHPQSENQSSNSFNLFSFKTSSLQEIYNNAHAEKEAAKEWMNEWQQMLYDFMHSLPLADKLKDELHKGILATEMNDVRDFVNAKDALANIFRDIANGTLTITGTLRAVFVGAYSKRMERSSNKPATSDVESYSERSVPFYDWINERESYAQVINNYSPIENWLEW